MIYKDDESGLDFDCILIDDGTMDTVISIDGVEHRFGDMADFRDAEGQLSEDGFFYMIEETLSDCFDDIIACRDRR